MNIRPKRGEVLLEVVPRGTSDGGVLIPPKYQYQERAQQAIVRKLGVWKQDKRGRLLPYEVKPGDRVVFQKNAGRWLHGEQNRLKLLPASRILAIVQSS
jgi:chaperonin GroES